MDWRLGTIASLQTLSVVYGAPAFMVRCADGSCGIFYVGAVFVVLCTASTLFKMHLAGRSGRLVGTSEMSLIGPPLSGAVRVEEVALASCDRRTFFGGVSLGTASPSSWSSRAARRL